MFGNKFEFNNRLFGEVLSDVMKTYGLGVTDLLIVCCIQSQ